jgi:hypothetical protein
MAGLSPEQRRTLVLLEGRRPVGEIAEQGITGEVLSGLGRLGSPASSWRRSVAAPAPLRSRGAGKLFQQAGRPALREIMPGSQSRSSFILGQASALPSHTRGGSRMRESRLYGSVRGARCKSRPYRYALCLLRLLTAANRTSRHVRFTAGVKE